MTEHFFSGKSQVYWTCKALTQGRTISQRDEIAEIKGWRLPAIVHTLRTEYLWPIERDPTQPSTIAYYRLKPCCDWRRLRFPPSARALLKGGANG